MDVREARIDNLEDATSKASPSVLPCQADGNFLPSLVGLMNMMTRVNKRRVGLVLFLAMLSWLGTAAVPVCARENISIGTAGDPGDGWGIASGGSTDRPTEGENPSALPSGDNSAPVVARKFGFVLIPYFDGTGLHFLIVTADGAKAGSLK